MSGPERQPHWDMLNILNFVCWVAVVALAAAFLLNLAVKWGIMEWLQVHAPNAFFEKLFNCKFCCSFHTAMIISLFLCIGTGQWSLLLVPVCTTVITRELW